MTFNELGLEGEILEAISYMGFERATPIQEQAIPIILAERDLMACAQTGTGKTAAFILPVLHKLVNDQAPFINTLVIAPTRELVLQIDQQIQAFAYFLHVTSYAVYGGGSGHDFEAQKKALQKGSQIIVATPGKLLSHINMGYVNFKGLKHFILDEADRMLDMGFYDDIKRIESKLPKERQTLMFSATMPQKIRQLSKSILQEPAEINIAISKPAEGVLQAAYLTYENQKIDLISELLSSRKTYQSILIFCSTKKKVSEVVSTLKKRNMNVLGVSSDLDQAEREAALRSFKALKTRILVATDVLSRGIDIKGINLIINYNVPSDAEDYVHRVGRTARADSTGVALTFISQDDMRKFARIEKLIETEIMKLPLPGDLGEGPEWNPFEKGKKRNGNRHGKSKKRFRKKGKK